jgi:hypothetical protein
MKTLKERKKERKKLEQEVEKVKKEGGMMRRWIKQTLCVEED